METRPSDQIPEKPSKDRADIEVYTAYTEAKHDREIQKIFFKIILPLYFITIWIAMGMLSGEQYEGTFRWVTGIVVAVFLFAFQSKIKAILEKLLLH